MRTQAQPFLLTQTERESRRLEPLRPQDLDKVVGGVTCTEGDQTIGGFTVCSDEDGNVHTDDSDVNE